MREKASGSDVARGLAHNSARGEISGRRDLVELGDASTKSRVDTTSSRAGSARVEVGVHPECRRVVGVRAAPVHQDLLRAALDEIHSREAVAAQQAAEALDRRRFMVATAVAIAAFVVSVLALFRP